MKEYFQPIPRPRTIPQNQSMEDTQKLTQLAADDLQQMDLLEDFFRGRNWTSDKQVRFNQMRAEEFGFLKNPWER